MMRLPPFRYHAPDSARGVSEILSGEGPGAMIVAGGTDLFPNMKRRHQTPGTLVSLRHARDMRGITWHADGSLEIGAGETLTALERDEGIRSRLPALLTAVASISTPLLRNTGTIGGNLCLDTRCNYYNQNWEWRRAIDFCMKCDGTVCWVAPSSPRCWAVNSSDGVPMLMALGAEVSLVGPGGERRIPLGEMYADDGIQYLSKAPDEVLTKIHVPAQGAAKSRYHKVRRRGAFDFPVAAVAVRVAQEGGVASRIDVVLNAVGSTPVDASAAAAPLLGERASAEAIEAVSKAAFRPAKPLDNTDHEHGWRKKMVRVHVRRALEALLLAD